MTMDSHKGATRLIVRLGALLAALREGPQDLGGLARQLGAAYPAGDSARRMLDRDLAHLKALGITVEREAGPRYVLRGGQPIFNADELRVLALIRDTFDPRHPQSAQIQALLERLTAGLSEREHGAYSRRQARLAPVRPAIDYTAYAGLIERLERAIEVRQPLSFRYRSSGGRERLHTHVEPYEIEFYERHFYLVAYSPLGGQILDFRLDRISDLEPHDRRLPPGSERPRRLITFRYRLTAALAQGALSQRFEQQRVVERLPGGDVVIEAQGRSDFFIIQTLLRYRDNAELIAPPELRARMAEEVRRLAAVYGG